MKKLKTIVYLSLGSNLGRRSANLRRAIRLIGQQVGEVTAVSDFLATEPWGFTSEHSFLNACVRVLTSLTPRQLLEVTQQIERQMGRRKAPSNLPPLGAAFSPTHPEQGRKVYHDRIIDIDILLYGDLRVDEPDLQIPHPLMHQRQFVMQPLRQICPDEPQTLNNP